MSDRIQVRVVWLVASALVATWCGALAVGVDPVAPRAGELIAVGALYGPRVEAGQWWRLGTTAFVHAGALLLAINAIGLYVLGTQLERRLGAIATGGVLVASTIAGSAASLWWSPYTVSAGASAALCGIAAALVIARPPRWALYVAIAWLAWSAVLAATTDRVDHAAHLGGALAGAGIALARTPLRVGLAIVAVVAAAALAVRLAPPLVDVRAAARELLTIEGSAEPSPDQLAAVRSRLRDDPRLPPRDRDFARQLMRYLDDRLDEIRSADAPAP